MPYGILKADTLTYYTATGDVSIAISGLAISGSPLISGVSGIFTTSVSGATVTGDAGQFTTITGGTAQFTNITGVSGTFTSRISGATVTGTSGQFTTLTATTGVFTSVSGGTVSGDVGLFNTISGNQGVFNSSLSVPSGTAASPSISFNGDPNTGIYSSGADQVAISTGGSGRLFVDASGRIGAGVPAPGFPLDLVSQSGESIRVRGTSGTEVSKLLFTSNNAGADYGWLSSASSYLAFGTAASERMRLTSTGLAIGTTSPGFTLDIRAATDGLLRVNNSNESSHGSADARIVAGGSFYQNPVIVGSSIKFNTYNGSSEGERARIDSSGRLLVGTSTSRNLVGAPYSLQIEGDSTSTYSGLSILNKANSAVPAYLILGKSRGGAGGVDAVSNASGGDAIGDIWFAAADGTDLNSASARITCFVDGAVSGDDVPGRLVFSTTADGASSPTERVRISQNGVVTVKNGAVAEIGTLADGATVTPDFAANCNFTLTISGNRTLANPTNITAGQTGSIFIIQGTGSNALSWGSYWDFTGGTAPTLSTASGAVDRVDYVVRTSTSIHTVFTANYS